MFFQTFFLKEAEGSASTGLIPPSKAAATLALPTPPMTRPISAHCKQAISVALAEDATTHYHELPCRNSFLFHLRTFLRRVSVSLRHGRFANTVLSGTKVCFPNVKALIISSRQNNDAKPIHCFKLQ